MQRDGLDPSIMDLDPEKTVASQLEPPPLKDDPTYTKVSCSESLGTVHE